MLFWRLISSAILVGILVVAAYFDWSWGREVDPTSSVLPYRGIMTSILAPLTALFAGAEFYRLTKRESSDSIHQIVFLTALMFTATVGCAVPVYYLPYPADCCVGKLGWPLLGMMMGIGVCFLSELARFGPEASEKENQPATNRIALATLAMLYIGLPMAMLIQLRHLGDNSFGIWAMFTSMVIPKLGDAGAYFAGRAFGKHKLAPLLSPKKTIEGAAGAFLGGVAGSLLMWYVIAPYGLNLTIPHSWPWAVAYGLILTVVGIIGDLGESLIKRDCGIKDSSQALPGLGGFLDVVDSVLFCAPAAFVFWIVLGT